MRIAVKWAFFWIEINIYRENVTQYVWSKYSWEPELLGWIIWADANEAFVGVTVFSNWTNYSRLVGSNLIIWPGTNYIQTEFLLYNEEEIYATKIFCCPNKTIYWNIQNLIDLAKNLVSTTKCFCWFDKTVFSVYIINFNEIKL